MTSDVYQKSLFGDYNTEKELSFIPNYGVKYGDIWQLGDHHVMCGDSTNQSDVKLLLANDVPRIIVTDPPYGVNYDPDWRNEGRLDAWSYARRTGEVLNDDQANWSKAFNLSPCDVAYVWSSSLRSKESQEGLEQAEFIIRSQIIWRKQHYAISRGHYHWQHELCWYAVKKGKTSGWIGNRKQSTVWDIASQIGYRGVVGPRIDITDHSTIKPIDCMMRPIKNHEGDVYEPFAGSGTTIIASEIQERKCYAMEIEPKYVETCIIRWENYTRKKAFKIS